MLEIVSIENYPINSTTYIIINSENNRAIIVDPGTEDIILLKDFIDSREIIIDYVVLTHEHIDHIVGINKLRLLYDFKIICSCDCDIRMRDPKYNLTKYADNFNYCDIFPSVDITFSSSKKIIWNNKELNFVSAKGHSTGSIYFYFDNCFFIGDTLIPGYTTYTTLPGGNKEELLETLLLLKKVFSYSHSCIYPGHGIITDSKIFYLDTEKLINKIHKKINI